MAEKIAIITGGNSGLGLECARALNKLENWKVVIACRDTKKALFHLPSFKEPDRVSVREVDLASLDSVRALVSVLRQAGEASASALICNAGIQFLDGAQRTVDGVETTFAVNHLSHFLLANLLLKDLARPARVLFVASGTHDPAQFTGGVPHPWFKTAELVAFPERDPQVKREKGVTAGARRYSTSKLCNVMCAYEMARRVRSTGVSDIQINALDPGLMPGTGLVRNYPAPIRWLFPKLIGPLSYIVGNIHLPSTSGKIMAELATSEKYHGDHGLYYETGRPIPSSKQSYVEEHWRDLWAVSERLSRLTEEERVL